MTMLMSLYITLMLLNKYSNMKNFMYSLESGFNNLNSNKLNLSMNFTYIMIIFIMFDIEVMFTAMLSTNQMINNINSSMTITFLMFMFITTLTEMKNNKIKWIK